MSYVSYDEWLEAKYEDYLENGDVTEKWFVKQFPYEESLDDYEEIGDAREALAKATLNTLKAIDLIVEDVMDFIDENQDPEHYGSW